MSDENGGTLDVIAIKVPLSMIVRLRLVFPAERIVHLSRGIDRTEPMPTRFYHTPAGIWCTDEPGLLRLLHNDFEFVVGRVAKVARDSHFLAVSTNYGSNPYYCIRRPDPGHSGVELFHLEQEDLSELHSGLALESGSGGTRLRPVQVSFDAPVCRMKEANGVELPPGAMVFTAPALIWESRFVGWERYARETYDCRHVVNLQYSDCGRADPDAAEVRNEIRRLQVCWSGRDEYVGQVLRAAQVRGFALYERLAVGVGGSGPGGYLLLASSGRTTAEGLAASLLAGFPDLQAAFQITEGGGTAILAGTGAGWRVLGPSSYRRGRVLCCLLVETGPADCLQDGANSTLQSRLAGLDR
jgi:hypothetical protein